MRVVHKYRLSIANIQVIKLPYPAQLIHMDTDPESPDLPVLWVLHEHPDTATTLREYIIRMIGTDTHINDGALRHISTIRIRGGNFVLHCFEEVDWANE